jgi:VWFA-related protein
MPRNLTIIAGFLLSAVFASVGALESQVNPAQEPGGRTYVLKSESPLVVLDVVVTDKKGQPVHGLKSSDFTVLEKDQEMTLQSFEEHRTDQAPPPAPLAPKQALAPNVFTNISDTSSNGPLNVLLMDALNTPIADQMYVREQMLEYVKKVPQGTRIGILGLSNRLYILQGFTTDPSVLKAAVQMFMPRMAPVPFDLRARYTLAAMEVLARYLSGLPGRKNLVWFAGSFHLGIMPDGDREGRFGAMANIADDEKWTSNLLTRSQVAVYPIDARGLFPDPAMGAGVAAPPGAEVLNRQTPAAFQTSEGNFLGQRASDKITMNMLAQRTGGKAFYDTNGLKEAVQEAISDGSNYYTLAYVPTNRKWDGHFRSVRVRVDQSGLDLSYRQGYFAFDPDAPRAHQHQSLPMSVMESAMLLGGPSPTQIPFMVKIVPTAGTENTLPPTNQPNVRKKMKPPYRRYTVWYDIDLRSVAFTPIQNGFHRGSLEFEILLYNPDGDLMNAIKETVRAKLRAEGYESREQSGWKFHQNIGAPAKGEFFLRIGVHDVGSDRAGAVEVPLAAIQPPPPAAGGM